MEFAIQLGILLPAAAAIKYVKVAGGLNKRNILFSLVGLGVFVVYHLSADQVSVDAVFDFEKLVMGSALHHNTCLHANDLVGILDGAQPVSHNNDGLLAAVDELIKRCLHQSL